VQIVPSGFGHHFSGITHRLYSLLSGWRDRDITLDLWGTDVRPVNMNSGNLEYRLPEGTRLWVDAQTPCCLARVWAAVRMLTTLMSRRGDFDIAHFHRLGWGELLSPVVLHRLGKKAVFTTSLFESDNPGAVGAGHRGRLTLSLYRQFDGVVAVSPRLAEDCRQHGIPNVLCLPNFLAMRQLVHGRDGAAREKTRRELSIPANATVLLFVGSVIDRKGFDLLAEGYTRLAARHRDLWLTIVGAQSRAEDPGVDEDFVRAARERIDRAGVASRAVWAGMLRDKDAIAGYYSAADIFVLPTRAEGLPNVLIEATAAGLPVVATNLSGCTDHVVVDGETGFLVSPGDVGAAAEAICRLVADPALRSRMGEAGRRRVLRHFTAEGTARRVEAVVRTVLQRRAARTR
jgi:glycosyltransferase involved in cell wall biosynthesis